LGGAFRSEAGGVRQGVSGLLVNPGGVFDVVTHGNPEAVELVVNGSIREVDHRVLATYLLKYTSYGPGQEVRLLSCSTGSGPNCFAQNLANRLGARVHAADGIVRVWPSGRIAVDLPGRWITFFPGG
jgi:hypothetical protein